MFRSIAKLNRHFLIQYHTHQLPIDIIQNMSNAEYSIYIHKTVNLLYKRIYQLLKIENVIYSKSMRP